MLKKLHVSLAGVGVAAFIVLGLGIPVAAHEGEDHPTTRAEATTRAQGKLDEARKKVCNNRVETIKKLMANAATAGQRHLEVFGKIQQRVQDFYVKNNVTVVGYDSLVATANAKKAMAEQAIAMVKNSPAFSCDGENPVASIDAFNGQVRAMRAALKDYRSAINSLLVAVRNSAKGGN